jgi:hypothetical protein
MYGSELVELAEELCLRPGRERRVLLESFSSPSGRGGGHRREEVGCYTSSSLVPGLGEVVDRLRPLFDQFVMYIPRVAVAAGPVTDERLGLATDQRRYQGDFLQSR